MFFFITAIRDGSSPLPDGAEESYEALRDILDDGKIDVSLNVADATVTAPSLDVTNAIEPSVFNIKTSSSFNNTPIPSVTTNEIILDCLNIPTPMPSPINKHSKNRCKDVFFAEHEPWKDAQESGPQNQRQSRKRKRNVSDWSDTKRKVLENQG